MFGTLCFDSANLLVSGGGERGKVRGVWLQPPSLPPCQKGEVVPVKGGRAYHLFGRCARGSGKEADCLHRERFFGFSFLLGGEYMLGQPGMYDPGFQAEGTSAGVADALTLLMLDLL